MDDVDAEYYAGVLREFAEDPDRFEALYLKAAASFIERQQSKIKTLEQAVGLTVQS